MKVRCYFTFSGSKIAKLARWACGPWGHMGIEFDHDDGTREGFEARTDEGFVGPFPMSETERYIQERGGVLLRAESFDEITQDQVEHIRSEAVKMTTRVSYSKAQLAMMFLAERYRFPLRHSPNKVVCSEAVARLLYPYVDLRDCNHKTFDIVSPSSAYLRLCEIQAGYNAGAIIENKGVGRR